MVSRQIDEFTTNQTCGNPKVVDGRLRLTLSQILPKSDDGILQQVVRVFKTPNRWNIVKYSVSQQPESPHRDFQQFATCRIVPGQMPLQTMANCNHRIASSGFRGWIHEIDHPVEVVEGIFRMFLAEVPTDFRWCLRRTAIEYPLLDKFLTSPDMYSRSLSGHLTCPVNVGGILNRGRPVCGFVGCDKRQRWHTMQFVSFARRHL